MTFRFLQELFDKILRQAAINWLELIERLAVEIDTRVHPRILQQLKSRPLDQFVEKAFQKYFLARLAVADRRELLQIKSSEEGR